MGATSVRLISGVLYPVSKYPKFSCINERGGSLSRETYKRNFIILASFRVLVSTDYFPKPLR